MKKVPLKDFFNGTCKYHWCLHNDYGYCTQDSDIEHYQGVLEGVADNFGTEEGTFTCHAFETEDYLCKECGSELKGIADRTEPPFPQYWCKCSRCN